MTMPNIVLWCVISSTRWNFLIHVIVYNGNDKIGLKLLFLATDKKEKGMYVTRVYYVKYIQIVHDKIRKVNPHIRS